MSDNVIDSGDADRRRLASQLRRLGYGPLVDNPRLARRVFFDLMADNSTGAKKEYAQLMRDGDMSMVDPETDERFANRVSGHLDRITMPTAVKGADAIARRQGLDPDTRTPPSRPLGPLSDCDKEIRDAMKRALRR